MLRVKIDKRIEERFRRAAMKKFGYRKGALSKAAEEAILMWLAVVEKDLNLSFEGDPVEAIDGLLAEINMDSVDLQHKIKDLWLKEVAENVSN